MRNPNSLNSTLFSMKISNQASSAKQVADLATIIQREIEDEEIKRKGNEALIKSNNTLADQHEEIAQIRKAISALLNHSLDISTQQSIALLERDKIEFKRYQENIRFTKIAAWSGVISVIFSAIAIAIQLYN